MVYKNFRNMIGETNEEKYPPTTNPRDEHEHDFLQEFGRHVHESRNVPTSSQQKSDNLARITGFGIGVGSLYLQEVLGYPFIVLRRQCQVNHGGVKHHILPFSLFTVVNRIHHRQGVSVFWKGWGSHCIVKGVSIATEILTCELLSLPRKEKKNPITTTTTTTTTSTTTSPDDSLPTKYEFLHECVKGVSVLLTLPLQSACFTDSVQSHATDEHRYIVTFFKDAFERLLGWYVSRGHGRLLPFRKLVLPSIAYGLASYVIRYTINSLLMHYNTKRLNIDDKVDEHNMRKIYYAQLMTTWLSTLVTDIVTYPLETVLLRLHLQGTRTIIDDTDNGFSVVPLCTNYDGFSDCVQCIVQVDGVGGLYKGFGALLLQYFVQLVIVKMSKSLYCN